MQLLIATRQAELLQQMHRTYRPQNGDNQHKPIC